MSSPPPDPRARLDAVRAVAAPVAERLGLDLVAVEILGTQRPILRVSIDRPGGAGVDECAKASHALSPALDVADVFPGPYALEVSTPGIERPVQRIEDFERFAGCEARLKTWSGGRSQRVTLLGVEGDAVRVRGHEGERSIPVRDVERCNLVLTLEQYRRLGEGLHPLEQEPS